MGRIAIVVSATLVVSLAAGAAAQPLPTIKVSAWEAAANGTGVTFKVSTPTLAEDAPPAFPDETADGHFAYAIDTSDLRWADECRCFRYYVVTVRSRQSGQVSRHKIKGIPSGSFEDQHVTVRLTISDGAGLSDAEDVSLPVASAPGLEPPSLVTVKARDALSSVSLAGDSEILVTVKNASRHAVQLPAAALTAEPDHPELWAVPPAISSGPLPLTIEAQREATFRLVLKPSTWQAVQKSIVPSASANAHTAIRVRMAYANPLFQQRESVAETAVDLRFRPSLISLGVALAVGVGLGSLIPLLSRRSAIGKWTRATAVALVAAIVLEAVGMFLVAFDSQFKVFGFDLDPWQTLPVVLLGISNGLLGLEAVKRLKFLQNVKFLQDEAP